MSPCANEISFSDCTAAAAADVISHIIYGRALLVLKIALTSRAATAFCRCFCLFANCRWLSARKYAPPEVHIRQCATRLLDARILYTFVNDYACNDESYTLRFARGGGTQISSIKMVSTRPRNPHCGGGDEKRKTPLISLLIFQWIGLFYEYGD